MQLPAPQQLWSGRELHRERSRAPAAPPAQGLPTSLLALPPHALTSSAPPWLLKPAWAAQINQDCKEGTGQAAGGGVRRRGVASGSSGGQAGRLARRISASPYRRPHSGVGRRCLPSQQPADNHSSGALTVPDGAPPIPGDASVCRSPITGRFDACRELPLAPRWGGAESAGPLPSSVWVVALQCRGRLGDAGSPRTRNRPPAGDVTRPGAAAAPCTPCLHSPVRPVAAACWCRQAVSCCLTPGSHGQAEGSESQLARAWRRAAQQRLLSPQPRGTYAIGWARGWRGWKGCGARTPRQPCRPQSARPWPTSIGHAMHPCRRLACRRCAPAWRCASFAADHGASGL